MYNLLSSVVLIKLKISNNFFVLVPLPPSFHTFINVNSTAVFINLNAWKTRGCPISHFEIQYKPQLNVDWTLVSNNILPDQKQISIIELAPATWYSLLVISYSDPGPIEKEYTFATLTENGGNQLKAHLSRLIKSILKTLSLFLYTHTATLPPLDLSHPVINYTTLNLLMPTICAVIILIVIFFIALMVIFRGRRQSVEEINENIEQVSSINERTLSMIDQRKESCLSLDKSKTLNKLYYPSPYATNHLSNQIEVNSTHHLSHHPHLDSNEIPSTFDRLVLEHTYDIPFPPKWV